MHWSKTDTDFAVNRLVEDFAADTPQKLEELAGNWSKGPAFAEGIADELRRRAARMRNA